MVLLIIVTEAASLARLQVNINLEKFTLECLTYSTVHKPFFETHPVSETQGHRSISAAMSVCSQVDSRVGGACLLQYGYEPRCYAHVVWYGLEPRALHLHLQRLPI